MQFRFEQTVPLPRQTIAVFHENPDNLAVLHGGWSRFHVLRHEGTRPGCHTWFEITVFAILPVALGFEHTLYEPPSRYGEQLIHGPFHRFSHIHEFEEKPDGVAVRDVLEISLPWYYGGEWVTRLLIAPQITKVFSNRQAAMRRWAQEQNAKQKLS